MKKDDILAKSRADGAKTDEAEVYAENKGRLVGSWTLGAIAGIFTVLLLTFPDWFPRAAAGTAALMVSLLWSAEFFGKYAHGRRLSHLLCGLVLAACALMGLWIVIESSIHLMPK